MTHRFRAHFIVSDNATATSSSDKQLQPEADVKAMAQFQNNAESMMYLQECINDLQEAY